MQNFWKLFGITFLFLVFVLGALFSEQVLANQHSDEPIVFELCSSNVKNIIVSKQAGEGTAYRFVITLNSVGARQFRQMEEEHFGHLIKIDWAGISFGEHRLYLSVPPNATQLVLVSKWSTFDAVERKFHILGGRLQQKKNLHTPCGVISRSDQLD